MWSGSGGPVVPREPQHGYLILPGCNGATKLQTPNVDRLSSEGVRFENCHASAAVCTPSQYSLITGRYAWRRNLGSLTFRKIQARSATLLGTSLRKPGVWPTFLRGTNQVRSLDLNRVLPTSSRNDRPWPVPIEGQPQANRYQTAGNLRSAGPRNP